MSLYDPERDRVRIAGRWLRWSVRWVLAPALLGVFVSANIDLRSLPLFGSERLSAVLFLDGQAYFGHLDDSGESGTLILRDVYYFKNSSGGASGLPVGLVRRGTEAHEPADGMRINRDRILAVERVGLTSPVAIAIQVEREISRTSLAPVSLNQISLASSGALATQRVAAEHAVQRAWSAAADQLRKLNELVLPVSKTEAQAITQKALADLRTVRRNALAAIANAIGMSPTDAEAYVRATEPQLEGQTFANEPGVLLAPDLDAVVTRSAQLYAQVGDAAAKQLTQPRTASPTPSPTPTPSPRP
ncbi:MAG TPA: hypothetical protein VGR46_11180 [Candidatus Limnocylindria bacterium]|jgi:hypothetical protein|nr:hypothetical protein [Candidatus Limnocylindria bacterium]